MKVHLNQNTASVISVCGQRNVATTNDKELVTCKVCKKSFTQRIHAQGQQT